MAYSWSVQDVFYLLGISYPAHKKEVEVTCPFCGSRKFSFNMYKGVGHCWKCNAGADSASFYAKSRGLSLYDARKEIEERLNIKKDDCNFPIPPREVYIEPKDEPLADIEVRDRTYRAFLNELTLSEKNYNMLLSRGFNKNTINFLNYKTFPSRSEIDFFALCRRLLEDGCTLKGVPGFFQTKKGDWTFVSLTKGIIMPSVDMNNRIAFLQVRKDDDLRIYHEEEGQYEAKCSWFSSNGMRSGTKVNTEVHFATDMKYNDKTRKYWPVMSKSFILTEGIMKADLIHDIMPEWPVISVAGVRNYKQLPQILEELKMLGVEKIFHCYDMDYQTNPNVADSMKVTKEMIEKAGLKYVFKKWETKIEVNGQLIDLLNGLDDYLAYLHKGIVPNLKAK